MSKGTLITTCPYCGYDVTVCGHTLGYRMLSMLSGAWRLFLALFIILLAAGSVCCTCYGLYHAAYDIRVNYEVKRATALLEEYSSLKAQTHMAELRVRKAKAEQFLEQQKK